MSAGELPRIATDPGVSAWVSANAGAGKTHVLTDRVTRLLLDGAYPHRFVRGIHLCERDCFVESFSHLNRLFALQTRLEMS